MTDSRELRREIAALSRLVLEIEKRSSRRMDGLRDSLELMIKAAMRGANDRS